MPLGFLAIAMAAQALEPLPYYEPAPYSAFDRGVGGWTVVRREDGCLMFHDRRPGLTSTSILYRVRDSGPTLSVMFSNPLWRLPERQTRGYQMRFNGADGSWDNLTVYTFRERDAENRSFVTLAFTGEGVASLLSDVSHADGLTLTRAGEQARRIAFPRSSAAVGRLLDCVGTVSRNGRPSIPGLS